MKRLILAIALACLGTTAAVYSTARAQTTPAKKEYKVVVFPGTGQDNIQKLLTHWAGEGWTLHTLTLSDPSPDNRGVQGYVFVFER